MCSQYFMGIVVFRYYDIRHEGVESIDQYRPISEKITSNCSGDTLSE